MTACHLSLLRSWLVEDRIVLDDVSWHFGLLLTILGHFLLLGVGLGLGVKWAGVVKSFDPTPPYPNFSRYRPMYHTRICAF